MIEHMLTSVISRLLKFDVLINLKIPTIGLKTKFLFFYLHVKGFLKKKNVKNCNISKTHSYKRSFSSEMCIELICVMK